MNWTLVVGLILGFLAGLLWAWTGVNVGLVALLMVACSAVLVGVRLLRSPRAHSRQ